MNKTNQVQNSACAANQHYWHEKLIFLHDTVMSIVTVIIATELGRWGEWGGVGMGGRIETEKKWGEEKYEFHWQGHD